MAQDLYPKSVSGVPPGFTAPSRKYRLMVTLLFGSLVLFLFCYLSVLGGLLWLAWTAGSNLLSDNGGDDRSWFALLFAALALIVFMVKEAFKRQKRDTSPYVEIDDSSQPELFSFINRLCAEIKAPLPYKVYLCPEVNAAVFYDTSLINLILPTKKNLVIGLGLVNTVSLSEFKAVLAHEFGHFAQNSMRLGSYVYVSNQVVGRAIYGRDGFDTVLDGLRRSRSQLAVLGLLVYGVVWIIRKVFEGLFILINRVERALSRQMEFQADLVSVSVSGSDALINALSRLEFANECLGCAMQDLDTAADSGLYSDDLYLHQTEAASYVRTVRNDPQRGLLPDQLGDSGSAVQVFKDHESNAASMWDSHPSHFDREQNAKRLYIRGETDSRSSWLLFRNPEVLRSEMTRRTYQTVLDIDLGRIALDKIGLVKVDGATPKRDAAAVQEFINGEDAESMLNSHYEGLFDEGFAGLEELKGAEAIIDAARDGDHSTAWVEGVFSKLYDEAGKLEYGAWMSERRDRRAEREQLDSLVDAKTNNARKTFRFRDSDVPPSKAPELQKTVEAELEIIDNRFKTFFRDVTLAHVCAAAEVEPLLAEDIARRYCFHSELIKIMEDTSEAYRILTYLHYSVVGRSLTQQDFQQLAAGASEVREALSDVMNRAAQLRIPKLHAVEDGTLLASLLLTEAVVPALSANSIAISGEWVASLGRQLYTVGKRGSRLARKSLGAIISCQERVAGEWRHAGT